MSDSGNFRIQHFDGSRKWLGSLGRFGSDKGQFLGQTVLTLADDGRVYVSDGTRHDIQAFGPDGEAYGPIGTYGTGEGEMNTPEGVGAAGGRLFFADGRQGSYTNGIGVITTDGAHVATLDSPNFRNVFDLTPGPDNRIYAADWDGRIHVVDEDAIKVVGSWKVGPGYPESTVQGLGVGPDGRVYAAEWTFNKVEIFEPPLP